MNREHGPWDDVLDTKHRMSMSGPFPFLYTGIVRDISHRVWPLWDAINAIM